MTRALLVIAFILLLAPVWFMATGSLQDIMGIFVMPPRLFPAHPKLDNYAALLTLPLWRWAGNTGLVVTAGVVLSVFLSTTAGYAFAFHTFPAKRALWLLLLAGIMIPRIAVLVPLFVLMRNLGLSGTLAAVILPVAVSPAGMYLARAYFETVPKSMLESARIDGAHEAQVLLRIVAPMARPIVTALALFAAIGMLGDYIWQMLVLQREGVQTMLVGLTRAAMSRSAATFGHINPVGRSLAVGVVLLVPLVLIFGVANRYFTSAIGGAIKE